MINFPDDIKELQKQYHEKYKKRFPFLLDEDDIDSYKQKLENELNKKVKSKSKLKKKLFGRYSKYADSELRKKEDIAWIDVIQ